MRKISFNAVVICINPYTILIIRSLSSKLIDIIKKKIHVINRISKFLCEFLGKVRTSITKEKIKNTNDI